MKNVVLIGASGFVGTAILNELLNRGNKVTAIVRNPEKITISNCNLSVVKADVSDVKTITDTCKGKDVVISAYNPGWTNPAIYEETLKNYPLILKAVKQAGIKRLLCVGGAGTLFCAPGLRVVDSGAIPAEIMSGVKSLGEFYLNTLCNEKMKSTGYSSHQLELSSQGGVPENSVWARITLLLMKMGTAIFR